MHLLSFYIRYYPFVGHFVEKRRVIHLGVQAGRLYAPRFGGVTRVAGFHPVTPTAPLSKGEGDSAGLR